MSRSQLWSLCLGVVLCVQPWTVVPCAAQNFGDLPGQVTGHVTDAATGLPIANVVVLLLPSGPSASTVADGSFQILDVPPGTYYVWAWGFSAGYFIDEHFDDIPCAPRCNEISGATPIHVTSGGTTPGIDFSLTLGGKIAGKVVDEGTGLPLPAGAVFVDVIDSTPTWRSSGFAGPDGSYQIYDNLPAGTYFAFAADRTDGRGEMFRERPCQLSNCASLTGTPIVVAAAETSANIDFTLGRRGLLDVPLCRKSAFIGDECTEANPQLRNWHVTSVLDHSGEYYDSSDGTVMAFTVDMGCDGGPPCAGLEEFGANSSPSGYRLDCAGTPISFGGQLSYSGSNGASAGTGGCPPGGLIGATSYLNYNGHSGYDFDTDYGDVVLAAADGVLDQPRGTDPVLGDLESFNALRIRHPNGLETWYLHAQVGSQCSVAGLCTAGQELQVVARQAIAKAGNTGPGGGSCSPSSCVGDHLHFEVRLSTHPSEVTDPFGCDPTVAAGDPERCRTSSLWIDRVYASGFDDGSPCGWSLVVGTPEPCR